MNREVNQAGTFRRWKRFAHLDVVYDSLILITTPEAWVPASRGFPYLSGAGRLIVADCIMLGAFCGLNYRDHNRFACNPEIHQICSCYPLQTPMNRH